MAQEWSARFYKSKEWASCRKGYISQRLLIDGGKCEECKTEPGFIVHHKIPLTRENIHNPLIALNYDNLKYECKQCHDREEGHWYDTKYGVHRKALFSADGQPIDKRKLE